MNTREKMIAEIREYLERTDAARLAFVLAFLRAGEREDLRIATPARGAGSQ
ncbi:MAG: hypothetical protein IKF99_17650 [Oscillospiraceae bacterium]|nr:hypothetical protein [Oscillospiraceae bacterium]